MWLLRGSLLAICLWSGLAPAAMAGMPGPLPENVVTDLRLNDPAQMRLEAISFFLAVLLFSAVAVWGLWNYLRRDFQALPRLTFGKALAGVVLWGLLFIIVLTMISGARELMTPGAWKKRGFTYRLATAASDTTDDAAVALRRQHLERLRTALWRYAATHDGRFPPQADGTAVPPELWEVPDSGGLRYLYVANLSASQHETLLLYEPELEPGRRFALLTSGDVVRLTSLEIARRRLPENKP
jgi:hypothetical protein